jgi:hypothetical protein
MGIVTQEEHHMGSISFLGFGIALGNLLEDVRQPIVLSFIYDFLNKHIFTSKLIGFKDLE